MSADSRGEVRRVQFYASGLNCVACTRAFREGLRSPGIRRVQESPMLNRVVVEFDPSVTDEAKVAEEMRAVAGRAGFKGRVVFSR